MLFHLVNHVLCVIIFSFLFDWPHANYFYFSYLDWACYSSEYVDLVLLNHLMIIRISITLFIVMYCRSYINVFFFLLSLQGNCLSPVRTLFFCMFLIGQWGHIWESILESKSKSCIVCCIECKKMTRRKMGQKPIIKIAKRLKKSHFYCCCFTCLISFSYTLIHSFVGFEVKAVNYYRWSEYWGPQGLKTNLGRVQMAQRPKWIV